LITPADPPLLPRQSILPAVFAVDSANSRLLEGYGWSTLFGTNNPADGTILNAKFGDGSLTTAKLQDAAVTSGKIANGAVTGSKLNVTDASAGQTLLYNGTNVVWSQNNAVNAAHADNASDAAHLNGFDWTALFPNGGNPQAGDMSVASVTSRGSAGVSGDLFVSGRSFLSGPFTLVQGSLIAPNLGANTFLTDWGLFLRNNGDFNHYLRWADTHGNQTGIDGPVLVGLVGGVLGTTVDWTLRWHRNGNVWVRGSSSQGAIATSKRISPP
jgi:hypothetical protein